ncbi:UNVERIFIED_CONTAM: hypothetical protein FKN15_025442 [Acipenser sinensis]
MEKRRQSLSPPEKTERPQTFSGFQRTRMLAGGTIHQVGAVNPDNWLCINLALDLTLLYIKDGLSFLYLGGKPMGIFGDGQSVVQKRNPPGGQAIGDGSGERSPGLRKIKALEMALSDMLMYWAIGIAAIQAVYCQEDFIKVECDPENQGVYSQQAVLTCKVVSIKKGVQIIKMMWCKVEADKCVGKRVTFENEKWSAEDERFSSGALEWNEKELSVSLLVQKTQVSDQGSYRFMIITDTGYDKGNTYLRVTAPYSVPVISSVPGINIEDSMPVTLTCNASGGYPPGQIHWFDQLDSNWTKSSALRTTPTQDGRFNLSSVFTTTASSSMALYKCVVVNNKMDKQRAEYQLAIGPGKQEGTKNATAITAVFVVVGALASGILILYIYRRRSRVEQTPLFVRVQPGQSATITCIGGSVDFDGVYLRRRFIQTSQVLYVHKSGTITVEKNYADRMKTKGDTKKLILTISNLTDSDTDGYFCEFVGLDMKTGNILNSTATGTLILVQDEVKEVTCPPVDPNPPSSSLQLTPTLMIITSLAAVCVLILCIIALIIWQLPNVTVCLMFQIKKCFAKQRSQQAVQDTVYEEMAKSRKVEEWIKSGFDLINRYPAMRSHRQILLKQFTAVKSPLDFMSQRFITPDL